MFKKRKKDENKTNKIPSSSNPLTIKVPSNQYIKSRNDLVDDFNHKLKPTYYAIRDLATRENVRIARLNSQIDSYFAVETHFREKNAQILRSMVHHKQTKKRMLRILLITLSLCCEIFSQISTKFWISGCHKRQ